MLVATTTLSLSFSLLFSPRLFFLHRLSFQSIFPFHGELGPKFTIEPPVIISVVMSTQCKQIIMKVRLVPDLAIYKIGSNLDELVTISVLTRSYIYYNIDHEVGTPGAINDDKCNE